MSDTELTELSAACSNIAALKRIARSINLEQKHRLALDQLEMNDKTREISKLIKESDRINSKLLRLLSE
jgi:hypothetical protein